MRAIVKTAAGPGNLELREIPTPEIGEGDLLLRVSYCGICGSDLHAEEGTHPCSPPVVLGHEFSGVVVGLGREVRGFEEGDAVAFWQACSPYPGVDADGGFAEFMRVPAAAMHKTPEGISQQEASQFETACTPMRLVREVARVQPGDKVVVSGAGMIGLLAASLAKIAGAARVAVVGAAADASLRLPMALEMGADDVAVFGEETCRELSEMAPDCWIEASGAAAAVAAAVESVARGGRIALAGMGRGPWQLNIGRVVWDSITLQGAWGGPMGYLPEIVELIRSGVLKMSRPLSVMPLSQWREAFAMLRRQEAVKILLDPSG